MMELRSTAEKEGGHKHFLRKGGQRSAWREIGIRRHSEFIEKNSEILLINLSYEWRKDQPGATALRIAFLVRIF